MSIDPQRLAQAEPRLSQEKNIWMVTVRPDGRPHLVPIWFVWAEQAVWIATGPDSVKVNNLRANPKISVALEDGNDPVIFEGSAEFYTQQPPQAVHQAFKQKYDWDITTDADYILLKMTPAKLLAWRT